MRADLLDAQAAIYWAVEQMPRVYQTFREQPHAIYVMLFLDSKVRLIAARGFVTSKPSHADDHHLAPLTVGDMTSASKRR